MRWSICNGFWIYGRGWFTYGIYLVIYPMVCFPVSKTFGIIDDLLMSGLVIVEVMLILVYENLCGIYATLYLLVLLCVHKLEFGLRARFKIVSYYYLVYMFKYMDWILGWLALLSYVFSLSDIYAWDLDYGIIFLYV